MIEIYGVHSLEESLKEMYGEGGYIFSFKKEDFHHAKGLGDLELMTKESPKPAKVERIDDPVAELKKLGILFTFKDLDKTSVADSITKV